MTETVIRLKVELQNRHLQTHSAFRREYEKIAATIDPQLTDTCPSRTQFHRWLSGRLKGLPYPHHCRVLEQMLPGYTAQQLFEPFPTVEPEPVPRSTTTGGSKPERDILAARTGRLENGAVVWGKGHLTPSSGLWTPPAEHSRPTGAAAQRLGHGLRRLEQDRRLNQCEVSQFAGLAGHIVDLETSIEIHIGDRGAARLSYRFDTLNLTDRPLARMPRELWFKHAEGQLDIRPLEEGTRRLAIQRVHDTANLSKFASLISPPIQPGESAIVGYTCEGGAFLDELYWRQVIRRYTRRFSIRLRHHNAGFLLNCSAIEEHEDGAENSATEDLIWDHDHGDVTISLTREYLRPNQSITLRWEVTHEHP